MNGAKCSDVGLRRHDRLTGRTSDHGGDGRDPCAFGGKGGCSEGCTGRVGKPLDFDVQDGREDSWPDIGITCAADEAEGRGSESLASHRVKAISEGKADAFED